jgi:hypothetical protein
MRQTVRVMARALVSMGTGAVLGAGYAVLAGAVHLGAYGLWNQIPAFALGCVLVGAGLGLLGRMVWALAGEAVEEVADGQSPLSGNPPAEPARRTADERGPPDSRKSSRGYGRDRFPHPRQPVPRRQNGSLRWTCS